MDLQDFNKSKLSVEDFTFTPKVQLSYGKRTSKQQASTKALLSGEGVEGYERGVQQISQPDTRPTALKEHMDFRNAVFNQDKNELAAILGDPGVDDETKVAVTQSVKYDINQTLPNTMKMLAEQTVVAPLKEDAPEAQEYNRDIAAARIDEMVEGKRKAQGLINSFRASREGTKAGQVVDTLEVMAPFAEWVYFTRIQQDLAEGDERALLLGQQKQAVFETLRGMSDQERAEVTEEFIAYLNNNDQVLLPDGNDLVIVDALEQMAQLKDYSNFERWFDNITSVLDIVGIGGILRAAGKAPKAAKATKYRRPDPGPDVTEFGVKDLETGEDLDVSIMGQELAEDVLNTSDIYTRSDVDPASPAMVIQDTNPDVADEIHNLVITQGDEAAEALYGTSKSQALSKDILPDAGDGTSIKNKPIFSSPKTPEPERAKTLRKETGNLEVTEAERAKFPDRLRTKYENVEGMDLHPNSLSIRTKKDGSVGVTGRYSPKNYGYQFSAHAIESAKFAFRDYGMPEESFTLLNKVVDGKTGETVWKPISREEASKLDGLGQQQEYSVSIDYDWRFKPEELEIDEMMTTGTGWISRMAQWTDKFPQKIFTHTNQGSIAQMATDPSSLLDPNVTVKAASVASDKATALRKFYVSEFEKFSRPFSKLKKKGGQTSKQRQARIMDYIHLANREGVPFKESDLVRRGFDDEEIDLLKKWRNASDVMWYANNADMVKTLRHRNYKVFEHKATGSHFFGKPNKNVTGKTTVYDPANDRITTLAEARGTSPVDTDDWETLELINPIEIDGVWIDHVVSRNTPEAGYTRAFTDDEIVLPYKEGYYPIGYQANYFIKRRVKMAGGDTKLVTIASANTRADINHFKQRLIDDDKLTEEEWNASYTFEKDQKFGQRDDMFSENTWSLASASNISAQRHRGKGLVDAGAVGAEVGHAHLMDPLEAVSRQISSLSTRVATRDVINTMKTRWLQSYGDYLDLPKNTHTKTGQMPTKVGQIVPKNGDVSERILQQARTNFNYIYSLENGYMNMVDEGYKAVMHNFANMFGEKGWSKLEKGAFALARTNPVNTAKSVTFKTLIALNPFRQMVIQRAQMMLTPLVNAQYAATRMVPDTMGVELASRGLTKNKEHMALWEEIKDLGFLDSVDSHEFVRQDSLRLADLTLTQKAAGIAMKPVNVIQRLGFDLAEQDVLISAYLAFRDKAIRAGKDIEDVRVREEVWAETRMFTLNMNKSGDVAINQNTASLGFQFMSHMHKSILQGLSNQNIKGMDRAKYVGYVTAMHGVNGTAIASAMAYIYSHFQGKPSSEEASVRETIEDGLVDVMLNKTIEVLFDEETAIDFSDLSPTDTKGFGNLLMGLVGQKSMLEVIQETPAGSLMFGGNARITNFFKTTTRAFVPWSEDFVNPAFETTYGDVARSFFSISSGYSNAFKSRYAWYNKKKLNSFGTVSDEEVSKTEAVAAFFGFSTQDEQGQRAINQYLYGDSSFDLESDMEIWYTDLKQKLAKRGLSMAERETALAVSGEAWAVWGENPPKAVDALMGLIRRDSLKGDDTFLNGLMRQAGHQTTQETWDMLHNLPDNEVRRKAIEIRELMDRLGGN